MFALFLVRILGCLTRTFPEVKFTKSVFNCIAHGVVDIVKSTAFFFKGFISSALLARRLRFALLIRLIICHYR